MGQRQTQHSGAEQAERGRGHAPFPAPLPRRRARHHWQGKTRRATVSKWQQTQLRPVEKHNAPPPPTTSWPLDGSQDGEVGGPQMAASNGPSAHRRRGAPRTASQGGAQAERGGLARRAGPHRRRTMAGEGGGWVFPGASNAASSLCAHALPRKSERNMKALCAVLKIGKKTSFTDGCRGRTSAAAATAPAPVWVSWRRGSSDRSADGNGAAAGAKKIVGGVAEALAAAPASKRS